MNEMRGAFPSDEGRYRLLVDSITDYAIFMLDPTGRVTSWNQGAQRFKGYQADEIVGEHFSRFYGEEDRAAGLPQKALDRAEAEGRFEAEGWRVRKDGSRFWAHVIIDPILDPSDALIGFAKITRDLTERRAAEDRLRSSEQQFRLLVQGVTDYAIYMLDPQGVVVSWNAGAQRIKGYVPDEILGHHFSRFYTEEDRAADEPGKALSKARHEGRFEKEGWRVRKDGTRFLAHVVIDAIRDDAGEILGFAKITRDISERTEAQRSLELAREALFQAQKMEAIGQLTGGIAHDFNNLLMAVLGSLELVRKRLPYDPRITPLIDNAVQGAERGAVLTQRMLAFARKQELRFEAVDLPSLVRGMMSFLERMIGPGVAVRMEFERDLPLVLTDPAQLEAAVMNLAVNARDAMPGGGRLTIQAGRRRVEVAETDLQPGDYVTLSIADTGEGMDEETIARATEPFFTTKGVGKGTGLGLSMVHGLAAQSGGVLRLRSRLGEGTELSLILPVASGAAEAKDPEGTVADSSSPRPARLRVLAVDDDPLVLTNTAAMLDDLGYEVTIAASAREALGLVEQAGAFDLVITDEVMPNMTGSELARELARASPEVPVVITTGYAELRSATTQTESPVARLPKPFTQRALKHFIENALASAD
jgi:PAS domain S-box-containing protein